MLCLGLATQGIGLGLELETRPCCEICAPNLVLNFKNFPAVIRADLGPLAALTTDPRKRREGSGGQQKGERQEEEEREGRRDGKGWIDSEPINCHAQINAINAKLDSTR